MQAESPLDYGSACWACTRWRTAWMLLRSAYSSSVCAAYCQTVMALPAMQEWVADALAEPDEIDELEAEF